MKKFCFTIDDNIRFFHEITQRNEESLFAHPYLALLRRLHKNLGLKIQLNLFYQTKDFNLSMFSERYKREWEECSDWLKLSFHSLNEKGGREYETAEYDRVYEDCLKTQKEIIRFAGEKSLAKTTTIHCCAATSDGVKALQDLGVRGVLGLFGTDEQPRLSYDCDLIDAQNGRNGQIISKNGMAYVGINCVLNAFTVEEVLAKLEELKTRERVLIMIHEQFFYPDYRNYQGDFEEKIVKAVDKLQQEGFISSFFEDLL